MNLEDFQNKTFLYPTDTILGLGCSIFDENSVEKMYQIKNRPNDKSLIILVNSEQMLQKYVDVPEMAWQLIDLSEKPITIVYENPFNLPDSLIAKDNTVAIRLTRNNFCNQLINKIKAPIVSTSANFSGEKTPAIFTEINQDFLAKIDFIFPECINFKPQYSSSSIIKISKSGIIKIIRE